jgi:anti-sigma factor RsiW
MNTRLVLRDGSSVGNRTPKTWRRRRWCARYASSPALTAPAVSPEAQAIARDDRDRLRDAMEQRPMRCEKAADLLHGYLDGELDAAGAVEYERHLRDCAACAGELDTQRSLRDRLRGAGLYVTAPASLRRDVRAHLQPASGAGAAWASRPGRWRWLAAAAALTLLVAAPWLIFRETRRGAAEETLAGAALDAHLRSLQLAHLTDVVSTDAHTVKPWFVGKLSYSPPVTDLAPEGFPLIGGRLDVVEGRTVAALVYGRRKHILSVFVWPADGAPETAPRSSARQGYNWIQWTHAGMRYWVLSDVAPAEMEEFARLLRR